MKKIGLIAHDNKKEELIRWIEKHRSFFDGKTLVATATTGELIERRLGLKVEKTASGPKGGDVQIAAMMVDGEIGRAIFLWDPLSPHPHDPDVKALLRIAVLYNIPIACNIGTADCLILK